MSFDIRIYGLNLFFWISHLSLPIEDSATIGSNYIGRGIFYFYCFQLSTLFRRDEMVSVIALSNYISDGRTIFNHTADISEAFAIIEIGVDSIDHL
jgi:hypothetical protein